MEYFDYLPPKYRQAFDELHQKILDAPNPVAEIKLFEDFSKVYTLVAHAWQRRIRLETVGAPDPLPKEVFKACLTARIKAFKQFYHPRYIDARSLTSRQEKQAFKTLPEIDQIYRLPYCKYIWSFCDGLMKKPYERYACEFLKKYLTFPHDQLYRFYRFIQVHAARRELEPSIKEKYFAAIASYNHMISIALDSDEWLKWMKETFEEKDWILNLECKISEHFFMKEIWFFYIEYLDSQNKIAVLDVYKRYCRLFIEDKDMQEQYSEAIKKYDESFHVFRWQCDQEEFQWDFETRENGCPKLQQLLEKVPHCICAECFAEKNEKYFGNAIKAKNGNKKTGILSKFFKKKKKKCGGAGKVENCLLCYDLLDKSKEIELNDGESDDDDDTKVKDHRCKEYQKAINFQPVTEIKFKSIFEGPCPTDIPFPKPLFQYIVQNANEKLLSQLYECSKYFFVKRRYLICGSVYIGKYETQFLRNLYYSDVESFNKLQVKKVCSGTNFVFYDPVLRGRLSPLIPKLCFCTLIHVVLYNQDLTTGEFDLIISGGKLEQIEIDRTTIVNSDEDGSHLTVEDLIEKLPHVAVFCLNPINPSVFTTSTTEKLSNLIRTTKFESFELWNIPNTFELLPFVKFMELYMVPRAKMELRLQPAIDDAYHEMFSQFCHLVRTQWKPFYAAPQIN